MTTGAGALAGTSGTLVLIVEDEVPIAEALAEIVEEAGYTALVAAHGREGLELARARHPALIITDLMMPYLDGAALIATLHQLAAEGAMPAIPIVVMTAAGRVHSRNLPADAVLNKPFDIAEVERIRHRFLAPRPA